MRLENRGAYVPENLRRCQWRMKTQPQAEIMFVGRASLYRYLVSRAPIRTAWWQALPTAAQEHRYGSLGGENFDVTLAQRTLDQ